MHDDRGFGAAPLPPPPTASGNAESRTRIEGLAGKRRSLIVAGIANAVAGGVVRLHVLPPSIGLLLSLGVAVFVVVATVRVADQLYGVGAAVGSAIAVLIPFVWIAVVIFLCVQSAKRIKAATVLGSASGPSTGY